MAKYIREFENINDYIAYKRSENFIVPNLSLCRQENVLRMTEYYEPEDKYRHQYLTFVVLTSGKITWKALGGLTKTISYSFDEGETWTEITSTSAGVDINVNVGDRVLFKGSNATYATGKSAYSGFEAKSGETATYNIEGNIMSLIGGDNYLNTTAFTANYTLCSIFKKSKAISAKNLVLPVMNLQQSYCYRAMFSYAENLVEAPEILPATGLSQGCYWYMFEATAIETAPYLPSLTLAKESYGYMFTSCANLNHIECMATDISAASGTTGWVSGVSQSGTFVQNFDMSGWTTGVDGIPSGWTVVTADYVTEDEKKKYKATRLPLLTSSEISDPWKYNGAIVELPYSVNAIDGHTGSYLKRSDFKFLTTIDIETVQPTYLWFNHADQSADIYIDNTFVTTHWGGYNAFFVDITNYIHVGRNNIKVVLNNTTRNTLAPYDGDFNFNATLGEVELVSSPVLPSMDYGYDGFHITSTVSDSAATVTIKTSVPAAATIVCTIDDDTYHYTDTQSGTGLITFTTTIQNPHLWNGKSDPHLYNITLRIYQGETLYHTLSRNYGFRYYSYVYGDTTVLQSGEPYTGFLLNGSPYLLRGVCMHSDLDGKANALSAADIENDFEIINELGCNFIRLAHYPHPKEVYDKCDEYGIIVQTEVPCVKKFNSTEQQAYLDHLYIQYEDMVRQHYNHPCIMFWGLFNEATTDNTSWAKTKLEDYRSFIKNIDPERWVGYVVSHSYNNPSSAMGNPEMDWFGGNIYVGWYINKDSNDPTGQLNARIDNIINNLHKPYAYSEYGCGGNQSCHSETPQTTTKKGNYPRHDIEYMMWLHEGHIAAIKNKPELLFTGQWQLFDIAVSSRQEGYKVCLDGETVTDDNSYKYLNDKGLVMRDHKTKKDTFYLYKAEWGTENFVHICGKNYTKKTGRTIKCYTNDGDTLSLYVNNSFVETVSVVNHIASFTSRNFDTNDVIRVDGNDSSDTFTFE